jgi:phosphoribosylanthranilate isomerase
MENIHVVNTIKLRTKTSVPSPQSPVPKQTPIPAPGSRLPLKIKICGLFRELDIDYVNEARPDYIGFVFAESKRQVSPAFAVQLRRRLSDEIIPVGVFVNAPIRDIAGLYHENTIAIAQLHGNEDDEYIARLKEASAAGGKTPIPVIKTVIISHEPHELYLSKLPVVCDDFLGTLSNLIDYLLVDSGAGSGKAFNWELLNSAGMNAQKGAKPWFLAGGIDPGNIGQAMIFNPYALDVSSGAETDGVKDREKIVQLVSFVRKG